MKNRAAGAALVAARRFVRRQCGKPLHVAAKRPLPVPQRLLRTPSRDTLFPRERVVPTALLIRNLHGAVQRRHPGGIDFVNHHAQSVIPDVDFELVADDQSGA